MDWLVLFREDQDVFRNMEEVENAIKEKVALTNDLKNSLKELQSATNPTQYRKTIERYMRELFGTKTVVMVSINGERHEIKLKPQLVREAFSNYRHRNQKPGITNLDIARRLLFTVHNLLPILRRKINGEWEKKRHNPDANSNQKNGNDEFMPTRPFTVKVEETDKRTWFRTMVQIIKKITKPKNPEEPPVSYYTYNIKVEGTFGFEGEIRRLKLAKHEQKKKKGN